MGGIMENTSFWILVAIMQPLLYFISLYFFFLGGKLLRALHLRSNGTWKQLLLITLRRFPGVSCARAQPISLLPTQYKPQPSPAVPAYLRTYNPTQIQLVVHGILVPPVLQMLVMQEAKPIR